MEAVVRVRWSVLEIENQTVHHNNNMLFFSHPLFYFALNGTLVMLQIQRESFSFLTQPVIAKTLQSFRCPLRCSLMRFPFVLSITLPRLDLFSWDRQWDKLYSTSLFKLMTLCDYIFIHAIIAFWWSLFEWFHETFPLTCVSFFDYTACLEYVLWTLGVNFLVDFLRACLSLKHISLLDTLTAWSTSEKVKAFCDHVCMLDVWQRNLRVIKTREERKWRPLSSWRWRE